MAIVFNDSSETTKEYSLRFKSFKGVDYSNTKLNVALNRATDMRNLTFKNNVVSKRNGFVEKMFVCDSNGNPLPINGFWEFQDKRGNKQTIIHAGTKIFKAEFGKDILRNNLVDISDSNTYVPLGTTLSEWNTKIMNGIKNEKSFGIVRGNRLYIFAGEMLLVYGSWSTRTVERYKKSCETCKVNGIPTGAISTTTICPTCGGNKKINHTECQGTGYIYKDGEKINCPVCGGAKDIPCSYCTDGTYECSCDKNHKRDCSYCSGGTTGDTECEACMGSGYERCPTCDGAGCEVCNMMGYFEDTLCTNCGGSIVIEGSTCTFCNGTGTVDCTLCNNGVITCSYCSGTGISRQCTHCDADGKVTTSGTTVRCEGCTNGEITCPTCNGKGDLSGDRDCPDCNGNGYVWVEEQDEELVFELRAVQDNVDTYIPTTTIGIAPIGTNYDGNRIDFEEANMLSRMRKNKLVGIRGAYDISNYDSQSSFEGSHDWFDYNYKKSLRGTLTDMESLSSVGFSFICDNITFEVEIPYNSETMLDTGWVRVSTLDNLKTYITSGNGNQLNIDKVQVNLYHSTSKNTVEFLINIGSIDKAVSFRTAYIGTNPIASYQLDCTNIDSNYPVSVVANGLTLEESLYNLDYVKGILEINFANREHQNPINGSNNIVVTFAPTFDKYQEEANKINKCKFGIVFGYNDLEFLFASGNKDYPNIDWHTSNRDNSEINYNLEEYEDFTYFGVYSYAKIGGEGEAIKGFSQIGDKTLVVHKEYNPNEPTMYLRNAVLNDLTLPDGSVISSYKKVYFPQFSAGTSESCISHNTIANLSGDKIFLSKNGIFGIEISNNIKSEERYTKERSRIVNNELQKENLNEALGIVLNNKYYLAIENKMYVADSRFKTQLGEEMLDTFSYEFWVWEWSKGIRINCLFVKDNALWFGTKEGGIYKFEENNFVDKSYTLTNYLGGGIGVADSIFTYNAEKYKLATGDRIDVSSVDFSTLYEIVAKRIQPTEGHLFKVDEFTFQNFIRYNEGRGVYVYEPLGSSCTALDVNLFQERTNLEIGVEYTIQNINDLDYTFELYKPNGDKITFDYGNLYLSFSLIKKLEGENVVYFFDENKPNQFKLINQYLSTYQVQNVADDFKEIITSYNGITNTNFRGAIRRFNNVECIWYTPIVNMGSSEYTKNIKFLTVVPDAVTNGQIKVGIVTKMNDKELFYQLNTQGVDTYNLGDLDFTQFSFDCSVFARAFTKKIKIKNANFVQLFFASLDNKECIINEMSIAYTIGRRNKGVR